MKKYEMNGSAWDVNVLKMSTHYILRASILLDHYEENVILSLSGRQLLLMLLSVTLLPSFIQNIAFCEFFLLRSVSRSLILSV